MNAEAERLIVHAILSHNEVIISKGSVSTDSAKLCALEIIKALKKLDTERAFAEVYPYSIHYGKDELWEMFLNELLK